MTEIDKKQERIWAMFCHLSSFIALLGFFSGVGIGNIGIPFANILGPLVIWLIKKNESSVIDEHGKESLNFQISVTIYSLLAGLLCFIFIGIPILFAIMIAWFVLVIIASIKASNGELYKYPITIHFIQ